MISVSRKLPPAAYSKVFMRYPLSRRAARRFLVFFVFYGAGRRQSATISRSSMCRFSRPTS